MRSPSLLAASLVCLLIIPFAEALQIFTQFLNLPDTILAPNTDYNGRLQVIIGQGPANASNGVYRVQIAGSMDVGSGQITLVGSSFTSGGDQYTVNTPGASATPTLTWDLQDSNKQVDATLTNFDFTFRLGGGSSAGGRIKLDATADSTSAVVQSYTANDAKDTKRISTVTDLQVDLTSVVIDPSTLNRTDASNSFKFTVRNTGPFAAYPIGGNYQVTLEVNTGAATPDLTLVSPASPGGYPATVSGAGKVVTWNHGTAGVPAGSSQEFTTNFQVTSYGDVYLTLFADRLDKVLDTTPSNNFGNFTQRTVGRGVEVTTNYNDSLTVSNTSQVVATVTSNNGGPFTIPVAPGAYKIAIEWDNTSSPVTLSAPPTLTSLTAGNYQVFSATSTRLVYAFQGTRIPPTGVDLEFAFSTDVAGVIVLNLIPDFDNILPTEFQSNSPGKLRIFAELINVYPEILTTFLVATQGQGFNVQTQLHWDGDFQAQIADNSFYTVKFEVADNAGDATALLYPSGSLPTDYASVAGNGSQVLVFSYSSYIVGTNGRSRVDFTKARTTFTITAVPFGTGNLTILATADPDGALTKNFVTLSTDAEVYAVSGAPYNATLTFTQFGGLSDLAPNKVFSVVIGINSSSAAGATLEASPYTNAAGTYSVSGSGTETLTFTLVTVEKQLKEETTNLPFKIISPNAGFVYLTGAIDPNFALSTNDTSGLKPVSPPIPTATNIIPISITTSSLIGDTPSNVFLTIKNEGTYAAYIPPGGPAFQVRLALDPSSPADATLGLASPIAPTNWQATLQPGAKSIIYEYTGGSFLGFGPIFFNATLTAPSTGLVTLTATTDVLNATVNSFPGNRFLRQSTAVYTILPQLTINATSPVINVLNSPFRATAVVSNVGTVAATGNFTVVISVAPSSAAGATVTAVNTLPANWSVLTAGPGSSIVYQFVGTFAVGSQSLPFDVTATSSGNVVLNLAVDPDNTIPENEEGENKFTLTIPAPITDVVVTVVSPNNVVIVPGALVPIVVDVTFNNAPASLLPGKVYTVQYLVTQFPPGGKAQLFNTAPSTNYAIVNGSGTQLLVYTYVNTSNPIALAAGTVRLNTSLLVTTAGPVTVTVIADPDSALVESSRSNNNVTFRFNSIDTNLRVTAVPPPESRFAVNTVVPVVFTIRNPSNVSAVPTLPLNSPGQYVITITATTATPGTSLTAVNLIDSAGAGRYSVTGSGTLQIKYTLLAANIPAFNNVTITVGVTTTTPGNLVIQAVADANIVLVEADRNLNIASVPLLALSALPSFVASFTSVPSNLLVEPNKNSITFTVNNTGIAATVPKDGYTVMVSIDGSSTAAGLSIFGATPPPGYLYTVQSQRLLVFTFLNVTVPTGTSTFSFGLVAKGPGTVTITVTADAGAVVPQQTFFLPNTVSVTISSRRRTKVLGRRLVVESDE